MNGGTKGAFTAISDSVYTLVVTPKSDSTTPITIDIPSNSVTNFLQNTNDAITQYVQNIDTIPNYTTSEYWPLNYTATMSSCDYQYTNTCFGDGVLTVNNGSTNHFGLFVPMSGSSYSIQNGAIYYNNIKIIPTSFKIGDVFSYTGNYSTDGFSSLKITVAQHYDQITLHNGGATSTFSDVIRFDCNIGRGSYPGNSTSIYISRTEGIVARIDHDYVSGLNLIKK